MRVINKEVDVVKEMKVKEVATQEEIYLTSENKEIQRVEVSIALKNNEGTIIKTEFYEVQGHYYEMLYSDSPAFPPEKPRGNYREIDLWYVIDLIRKS